MAAVLACGAGAALSGHSAAEHYGIRLPRTMIHVSVPADRNPRRKRGIRVHRRRLDPSEIVIRDGIPVTTPVTTLVDLAAELGEKHLEAAINEADVVDLVHPERLRAELDRLSPRPGLRSLRELLDRRTLVLTRSDLEGRFVPIAREARLGEPETQVDVNGFEVDFYFPDLGLVIETDGGRFHRTPAQQRQDRIRDQAHMVAGMTPLRFTHAQIAFEPAYVKRTLAAIAEQLAA